MAKEIIMLSTREELKIFMSPLRQQLIRAMRIEGDPMTAKALSDMLGISASSVQHHLRLLQKLGLVELDHTKMIHGIRARYFRLCDVDVSIGAKKAGDALGGERMVVIQNLINNALDGLSKRADQALQAGIPWEELKKTGDFLSGVVHLTRADAAELMRVILEFIEKHEKKADDTQPWEYALILYNTGTVE